MAAMKLEIKKVSKNDIRTTWRDYVYAERIQKGWYGELIEGRRECYCEVGRTSYPHWPPTSQHEAASPLPTKQPTSTIPSILLEGFSEEDGAIGRTEK